MSAKNGFLDIIIRLNKECCMNIKLSSCLLALSSILYGCTSSTISPNLLESSPVIVDSEPSPSPVIINESTTITVDKSAMKGTPIKTNSDGTHLKGLPMTRDFIMDSHDDFRKTEDLFQTKGSRGSKKIFSIKPTGDIQPRAVILLKSPSLLGGTVRKKHISLCEGFMTLPPATPKGGTTSQQADRNKEVITFMPVKGTNPNNILLSPKNCGSFIKTNYDYASAEVELDFILAGKNIGKSPYLAVYESPQSPYSSMVLSLGTLSPDAISVLTENWSDLIMKVYKHGDSIDPTMGTATMLALDPRLQQAQRDAQWRYIKIAVTGVTCGGAIAASTVTLNTLFTTAACKDFILKAADEMGYELPENFLENLPKSLKT